MESKEKQIQEIIINIDDLKNKLNIINVNKTKELEVMTAKHEVLKVHHASELNQLKHQAA